MLSTHCRARGALRSLLEGPGTEISFPKSAPSPLHHCPGHPRAPSSARCSRWLRAPTSTCSKVMSLWEGPQGLSASSSPTPDQSVQAPTAQAQPSSAGLRRHEGHREGRTHSWAQDQQKAQAGPCALHTQGRAMCAGTGDTPLGPPHKQAAVKLLEHSPQQKPWVETILLHKEKGRRVFLSNYQLGGSEAGEWGHLPQPW